MRNDEWTGFPQAGNSSPTTNPILSPLSPKPTSQTQHTDKQTDEDETIFLSYFLRKCPPLSLTPTLHPVMELFCAPLTWLGKSGSRTGFVLVIQHSVDMKSIFVIIKLGRIVQV